MANSNIAAFPYYGGKHRLSKKIVPIIESIPHKVYVEPCCGGASVFFRRKPDPKRVDVLNDINKDVYAVYRAFQLYPDEMIREIQSMPYSEALYQECKEIRSSIFSLEPRDLVLRGAASYFHICTTFGNIQRPSGLVNPTKGRNQKPLLWRKRKALISATLHRLSEVYIDCQDLAVCISRWDSRDTLFYIDPPYHSGDCTGYSTTGIDYYALAELLHGIKGQFVMSGYGGCVVAASSNRIATSALSKTIKPGGATEYLYMRTHVSADLAGFNIIKDDLRVAP